jgi:hypothetical protein
VRERGEAREGKEGRRDPSQDQGPPSQEEDEDHHPHLHP